MTGLAAFPSSSSRSTARWVGRPAILPNRPDAPQWLRYLALTLSMFGLQLVWSCEMAQASPFLLSLGVSKSMMSVVFLAGPLSGLIVQPLVGYFSDACKSTLGRRRPFIIAGCLLTSVAVMMLGWSREIAGLVAEPGGDLHKHLAIANAVVSVYIIDFAVNVVQAMDRSLLVDVVLPHQQAAANAWASRMFGVGAVFGFWIGGVDLVWVTRGWLGSEQLKVLTFFTSFFLLGTHAITCSCVTERVLLSRGEDEHGNDAGGGAMQALEDIWQTIKTLPRPIRQVFDVQFTSWIGWFPVLFFSTTWIAEIYVRTVWGDASSELATAPDDVRDRATRAGTHAMLWHAVVSLATSVVVPALVEGATARAEEAAAGGNGGGARGRRERRSGARGSFDAVKRFVPAIPVEWLSIPLLWTISNGIFAALLLFGTWMATSVGAASAVIAAIGFCWSITNWAPFSILGDLILRLGPSPPSSSIALQDSYDSSSREHLPLPLSPIAEEASDYSVSPSRSRNSSKTPFASTRQLPPTSIALPQSSSSLYANAGTDSPHLFHTDASSPVFSLGSAADDSDELPFTPTTSASRYFDASSLPPGSSRAESYASASSNSASYSNPNSAPPSSFSGGSRTPTLTASPHSSPGRHGRSDSSASRASSIAYPPNHGSVGLNLLGSLEAPVGLNGGGVTGVRASGEYYGSDPYAYHSGGAGGGGTGTGASSSTVHLPTYGGREGGVHSPDYDYDGDGQVLKVRHSDSFDLSASERASFESDRSDLLEGGGGGSRDPKTPSTIRPGNAFTAGAGGGGVGRGTTPRIMVGGEDGEETEEWEGEERSENGNGNGGSGGGGGGGDQTGVILGCHNIFLVLPQFLVTALSSVIFFLLAPHHSVISAGAHSGAGVKLPLPGAAGGNSTVTGSLEDDIYAGALGDDEFARARLVVRVLARGGEAMMGRRAEEGEVIKAGWDALGIIFRVGGISAIFSTYICFKMWWETKRAAERQRAVGRGYRLG